jgi:hypothetical protein
MECFGTTDFDNNSRLITLSAIIISGLNHIKNVVSTPAYNNTLYVYVNFNPQLFKLTLFYNVHKCYVKS